MSKDILTRLESLEAFAAGRESWKTVFILEDGTEFRTELTPEAYLRQYGNLAPDGRKILRFPHPDGPGVDPLSQALYELIDSAIREGRLVLDADDQ